MRNQKPNTELRQKINLYLDNALGAREQEELLDTVNSDPRSNQMFEAERNSRDYIKNNVKRQSVSPDLIQSIRDNIRIK